MIIEKGKYYIQIKNGYIIDAVEYNPNIPDYHLFQSSEIPFDIMNQCYQLIDGKLVLDETKHSLFLKEIEKQILETKEEIE